MTKQYEKMVVAKFDYANDSENYSVVRAWPCWDHEDAELTVKYYGMKTGAVAAECNIEDIKYEEIKSPA